MVTSIGLAVNVYNDCMALRGLLEIGSSYFDNIFIIHSGPNGAYSTDGTIELCEEFGIKPIFDDISKGYGVIRTRLLKESGCAWTAILDADERFYPTTKILKCEGSERWSPDKGFDRRMDLNVIDTGETSNQGKILKIIIQNESYMAVRTIRRHWMDFTFRNPSENFNIVKDYQLRIVRNDPNIHYEYGRKMHEHLVDDRTGQDPTFISADEFTGPVLDHYHCFFRAHRIGYKERNELNYNRLNRGEPMVVDESAYGDKDIKAWNQMAYGNPDGPTKTG
jgi:hypothetical protein